MKAIKGIEIFDGHLLVKRDEPESEDRGIVLPEMAKRAKLRGTVVLTSKEGRDGKPMRFKAGDRVRFREHLTGNFAKVEVGGEEYILMPCHWIWARDSA